MSGINRRNIFENLILIIICFNNNLDCQRLWPLGDKQFRLVFLLDSGTRLNLEFHEIFNFISSICFYNILPVMFRGKIKLNFTFDIYILDG